MAVKKMVMTPFEEENIDNQVGGGEESSPNVEQPSQPDTTQPRNKIKAHALDRQKKLIAIILKLAKVNGYNDYGEIRAVDGKYRHDIVPLLAYALSRDTGVKGLDDFVQLLREADVSTELILNGNLRAKLNEEAAAGKRHQTNKQSTKPKTHDIIHVDDNALPEPETDGTNVALPDTDDSDLQDDVILMDDDVQGRKRKRVDDAPAPPPPRLIHHESMPRLYKKLRDVGWESKNE